MKTTNVFFSIVQFLHNIFEHVYNPGIKYLDAEDEGQNVCPAEDGDDADAAEDSDGAVLVGVFFVSSVRCAAASYPFSEV